MSQKLLPDVVLYERYKIQKVISFTSRHGVYIARDMKVTEKSWIVKEYIPPVERFSEEELKDREEKFSETLEIITNFEHPNLPRILDFFQEARRYYVVMESIDGITLKAVSDMSVERIEEAQILEWVYQISDALAYLHSRPKPFVHTCLDPEHLMVDSANQIKLVNLGLERFFDPDSAPHAFSINPYDIIGDFFEMGKSIYFLYARKEFNPQDLMISAPNASEKVNKLLQRLLSDDPQRNYRDAGELCRDIKKILHPATTEAVQVDPKKFQIEIPFYFYLLPTKQNIDRITNAILSQKIVYFVLEIIGIIALIIILWMARHPGWNYTRTSSVILCACQDELWTIDSNDKRLLERKTLDGQIKGIASNKDGSIAYLSNFEFSHIMKMSTIHNEILKTITVDKNPSRLLLSGTNLFCINEMSNNISVVSLNAKEMTALVPTGDRPADIAFASEKGVLYISDSAIDSIHIINPITNITSGIIQVSGGVGPLALSPDEKLLYIGNTKYGGLTVLDTESLSVTSEIIIDGLKTPCKMKFSQEGDKLYILDRDAFNFIIFSTTENQVVTDIKVGKNPVDMTFDNQGRLWIANNGSHNISIVNPELRYLETTIGSGRKPEAIQFIP